MRRHRFDIFSRLIGYTRLYRRSRNVAQMALSNVRGKSVWRRAARRLIPRKFDCKFWIFRSCFRYARKENSVIHIAVFKEGIGKLCYRSSSPSICFSLASYRIEREINLFFLPHRFEKNKSSEKHRCSTRTKKQSFSPYRSYPALRLR